MKNIFKVLSTLGIFIYTFICYQTTKTTLLYITNWIKYNDLPKLTTSSPLSEVNKFLEILANKLIFINSQIIVTLIILIITMILIFSLILKKDLLIKICSILCFIPIIIIMIYGEKISSYFNVFFYLIALILLLTSFFIPKEKTDR